MVIVNISGNGIFCIYKCTINDCSYGAWLGIGHVDATAKRRVGSDCRYRYILYDVLLMIVV